MLTHYSFHFSKYESGENFKTPTEPFPNELFYLLALSKDACKLSQEARICQEIEFSLSFVSLFGDENLSSSDSYNVS